MKRFNDGLKKAAVLTLTGAMITGCVVPSSVSAATKLTVSNNRTVLVEGRNYKVTTANASSFKSSDKSVATVSKTGKITPLKTGYVTISAKVGGKTIKRQLLCVSASGATASQSKLNKMLKAENVKKVAIKTGKEANYVIAKGDYAKKTLTINAPKADVKNSGSFAVINVKDVKAGTLTNYVTNKLVITDKDFKLIEKGKGSVIEASADAKGTVRLAGTGTNVATEGALTINSTANATIDKVTVKGGTLEFDASKNPTVKEIVIEKKAEVKVTGEATKEIPITVAKGAEGTKVEADSVVKMTVNAQTEVKLSGAAGGSEVKFADDVKATLEVDKDVKGTVSVGVVGSDVVKSVSAGSAVSVAEGGKITDTTGAAAGGVETAVFVETTYDKEKDVTTYKLQNATSFDDLASVTVKATLAGQTETIRVTKEAAKYIDSLLEKDAEKDVIDTWLKVTSTVTKKFGDGAIATITTPDAKNPASKLVKFETVGTALLNNKTFSVVYDELTKEVTIREVNAKGTPVANAKTVVLFKSDNTLEVMINSHLYTLTKVDATTYFVANTKTGTTYTVKTDANHTFFSVSGDVTEKLVVTEAK